MKLTKIDKERGIGKVAIISNRGTLQHLEYPLESIFDWYPCCQRYDYKMSESREKLYLVLLEEKEDKKCRKRNRRKNRYSVGVEKSRVDSETGVVYLPKWSNREVKRENKRLFTFAKEYDIITPDQDYTLEQVQESITRVLDVLDMLYSFEYNKLREYYIDLADKGELVGDAKKAYDLFILADREDKASFVLESCKGTKVDELYEKFGEVYVMLQVMRKVVE